MPLMGKSLLMNWSSVAPADRAEYYEWHVREHMPGRVRVAGFARGRRYIAARAERDFFQFYELADRAVLSSPQYLAVANNPSALTRRVNPSVRNSVRIVADVASSLGSGEGRFLATFRVSAAAGERERLGRCLMDEVLPRAIAMPEIVGAHLSRPGGQEGQKGGAGDPDWVVMLEGISREALEAASAVVLSARGAEVGAACEIFCHEFTLAKGDLAER
jgi:hypothetical protein